MGKFSATHTVCRHPDWYNAGILKRTRDDWIRMDSGYLARIAERKPLIEEQAAFTIGTGVLVNDAIEELYTEIMVDYLPHRYPTIFKASGDIVHNVLTHSTYPLSTKGLTPEQMLQLLGLNVEEDFYFMLPDEKGDFRLQGYIACFPGGFLSPATRGKSVREIHQPVPGYEERLGRSVDRHFNRMVPGDFIGRMNVSSWYGYIFFKTKKNGGWLLLILLQWSLQVDGIDLFRIDGNNYYPEKGQEFSTEKFKPHFSDCYLRTEHQTLTKLPRSQAIMFCVRSFMTPLEEIKSAGEGPKLAAAIESMPEKLGLYKMRHFWGGAVLPWLKDGHAVDDEEADKEARLTAYA